MENLFNKVYFIYFLPCITCNLSYVKSQGGFFVLRGKYKPAKLRRTAMDAMGLSAVVL